jgi:hypothetical protein
LTKKIKKKGAKFLAPSGKRQKKSMSAASSLISPVHGTKKERFLQTLGKVFYNLIEDLGSFWGILKYFLLRIIETSLNSVQCIVHSAYVSVAN